MTEDKNEQLKEMILAEAVDERLSCQKAFAIAAESGLDRAVVGKVCNELGVKVVECQLGCF